MLFLNALPHLKVYRQKVLYPVNNKIQSMYSLAILNNGSIESSAALINSAKISHNNRFHSYFMNSLFNGKFFGRMYREMKAKERLSAYEIIESKSPNMITQTTLTNVNGKNLFYDIRFLNEIFFSYAKKAMSFKQKSQEYLALIKSTFDDPKFDQYTNKVMLVDVDSWVNNLKTKIRANHFYDNPIFLLYYAMMKDYDKFKELGNIDIILVSGDSSLRLNPSLTDKRSFLLFRNEMARLNTKMVLIEDGDKIDEDIEQDELVGRVTSDFMTHYNFTGDAVTAELEEKVKDRIEEIVEDDSAIAKSSSKEELADKLSTAIINDDKILKDIHDITIQNVTKRQTASSKRDELLRERQKEIRLQNMTIDDLRKDFDRSHNIDSFDVTDKVKTTNPNITKIKFPNFEKTYNEKYAARDFMNMLTSLNEKSIPVYILKIEVEDSSDELNYKETYTINLEDSNRVRHTIKFDMPKFIDDKFLYLNGNTKLIDKQRTMRPIVKTGPDEVQVVSNYNKIFIRRYGLKASSKIEKFKKAITTHKESAGVTIKNGNNINANSKVLTIIEYDELSKEYTSIKFKNTELMFNQDDVKARLDKLNKKIDPTKELCVGFNGTEPIIVNLSTQLIGDLDIIDYILSVKDGSIIKDAFDEASGGKKFVYSRATIMAKQVPIVLLLGYLEGLSTVLRKAEIKHYFTDKRPKDVTDNQGVIQFADGYLVYDRYPFENSLLMNAFADIPSKGFEYVEFDQKDAYLTIFDSMFNTKIIGNAFDNFYDWMIDSITKEVLEDYNYPTDFVSLMLFANALLADNDFTSENEMKLYRVRSNELVNAYFYKALATAYINYRLTANNNNPVKISLARDAVTKQLLMAQTVQDYSRLNPIVEVEKSRAISPKGLSGMNLDQAYTQDKRAYSKSMLGIIAMSTSPDANVGVMRQLSLEPNIISGRGYLEVNDGNMDKLKDVHLFSPAELLSPLGAAKDDSTRTAMATKQSKHIVPVTKSSPVLISNGAEQILPYHLSNDFSIVAKNDGEVIEIDEKNGLVVVGYYDGPGKKTIGTHQAINVSPTIVKNGAGGFYLSNTLKCELKVGQKFKENDILAADSNFFTQSKLSGTRFNIGSLQKIACMSSSSTYEDSTFVTTKLTNEMSSDIVMAKTMVLGKNANVDFIVKVGDSVSVGDDLIRFETSFEDDSLNKFLATIGEDLQEEIKSMGKTPIKSKYTGVIEDVRIYSTLDIEELSPSLQKIANMYYNRIDRKRNVLNKYDKSKSFYKMGIMLNEPTGKIETKDGKIKGNDIGEGVLIEIYIKYKDVMGIGDKLAFFTALKSIIGEVIPEGYEPYSEFRPTEEVSSFVAPGAVLARMTPSILITMLGNKVLVELKRSLQEIYTGKPWEPKEPIK